MKSVFIFSEKLRYRLTKWSLRVIITVVAASAAYSKFLI